MIMYGFVGIKQEDGMVKVRKFSTNDCFIIDKEYSRNMPLKSEVDGLFRANVGTETISQGEFNTLKGDYLILLGVEGKR